MERMEHFMKRRIIAALIALTTVLPAAQPALAATASVKKTEYEGAGRVEIDFRRDVQYKNLKLTVKDSTGKTYAARILQRDEDDLTFQVQNIQPGMKYAYSLSGVRAGRSGKYGKVSGKFSVPSAKPTTPLAVKRAVYDAGDRELDLDFNQKVSYKNLKVKVKDSTGKSYSVRSIDRDDDGLNFRISNIAAGRSYTYTITGIRAGKSGSYGTLKGSFSTPAAASVSIKEVDCDLEDRELSFEFSTRVKYKNPKVTVKDSSGKRYSVRILERDSEGIEARVSGLKRGKTYTLTVSGVSAKGGSSFKTLSKSFVARDD